MNLQVAGSPRLANSPRRFLALDLPASSPSKRMRNFLSAIFLSSISGSKSSLYPPTDKVATTEAEPFVACQILIASISPSTTRIRLVPLLRAARLKSSVLTPACIFQYDLSVLSRSLRGRAAR